MTNIFTGIHLWLYFPQLEIKISNINVYQFYKPSNSNTVLMSQQNVYAIYILGILMSVNLVITRRP